VATATLKNNRIELNTPYELKDRVKALRGVRWDPRSKVWYLPATAAGAYIAKNFIYDLYPPEKYGRLPEIDPEISKLISLRVTAEEIKLKKYLEPAKSETKPWYHQTQGYHLIKLLPASMLAFSMGTGKTKCVVDAVCNITDCTQVLIVCPKSVIDTWPAEFEKHARYFVNVIALREGTIAARTKLARQQLQLANARHEKIVLVINYDAVWRNLFGQFATEIKWDMIVADECVPLGTKISTPLGDKKIEDIQLGDLVYGFDHKTGKITETIIKHIFRKTSSCNFVQVGNTYLTPEHPVFTDRGYIAANLLKKYLDSVYCIDIKYPMAQPGEKRNVQTCLSKLQKDLHYDKKNTNVLFKPMPYPSTSATTWTSQNTLSSYLPNMRRRIFGGQENGERQTTEILWYFLFCQMANVSTRTQSKSIHRTYAQQEQSKHAKTAQKQKSDEETSAVFTFRQESFSRSQNQRKGFSEVGSPRLETSKRWQWRRSNETPVGIISFIRQRMVDGALCKPSENRHSKSNTKNSNRSGRPYTQNEKGSSYRYEKKSDVRKPRMESFSLLELGYFGKSNTDYETNQEVMNLETTTGNYFANGLLVHNCHKIKAPAGRCSKFMAKLKAVRKVGLSGTPLPHSPLDAYAQYRFLDPGIFGTSFVRFRAHFAVLGGFENHQVIGYQNEQEFNELFYSIAHRVKKEDVLDLPPVIHEPRIIDLGDTARKAYDELEKQFIADVGEGIITAANALARLIRLQQITSGFAKLETGTEMPIDTGKAEALADILDDLEQSDPLVVFCRFRRDLETVQQISEKAERKCFELSGSINELAEWKAATGGEVLAVQIQAGGLGIDLTRSAYACYYSLGFSLGDYEQSMARLHRPGQKRSVTYLHLVARKTVDEKVYKALKQRKTVIESILAEIKHGV